MAKNTRNYQQIEADRLAMNRLALAGVPQANIASRFGVSQPQVSYDLRVVRERWKETATMNLEAARDSELVLLAKVEERAWKGWQRAEQEGDSAGVRFAAVLLKVSEQRAALLGLPDNPPKPAAPDGAEKEERLRRIEAAYHQKVRREVLAELGRNPDPAPPRLTSGTPTG